LAGLIVEGLERSADFDLAILVDELNAQYPIEDETEWIMAEVTLGWLQGPVRDASRMLSLQPLHKRAILDALAAVVVAPSTAEAFSQQMDDLLHEAQRKQAAAARSIRERDGRELAGLPLSVKCDLLRDLVSGHDRAIADEALTLLYPLLDLDPDFAAADAVRRRQAGETLRGHLRSEVRHWARCDDSARLALLNRALSIHCSVLGMAGREPTLVPVYLEDEHLDGEWLDSCGNFDPVTGVITLNPRSSLWNDIDQIFNTVIHENTHNYQMWLAAQLTPEQMIDPRHLQATLFALNRYGYLKPSAGEHVYKRQPVERHAFLAGDEVMGLWLEEAREEGEAMLAKLANTRQQAAAAYHMHLSAALEAGSVSKIFIAIDSAQTFLDWLPGEAAVKQLQALEHHPGRTVILEAHRLVLLEELGELRRYSDPGSLKTAIARLQDDYDTTRPGPPPR
jgi:hypothetical protein